MQPKSDTWARTIVLVIALVNQVLATMGKDVIPIAESDIYQIMSIVFTIATALISWWKNNSFTPAAIAADLYKEEIKGAK